MSTCAQLDPPRPTAGGRACPHCHAPPAPTARVRRHRSTARHPSRRGARRARPPAARAALPLRRTHPPDALLRLGAPRSPPTHPPTAAAHRRLTRPPRGVAFLAPNPTPPSTPPTRTHHSWPARARRCAAARRGSRSPSSPRVRAAGCCGALRARSAPSARRPETLDPRGCAALRRKAWRCLARDVRSWRPGGWRPETETKKICGDSAALSRIRPHLVTGGAASAARGRAPST